MKKLLLMFLFLVSIVGLVGCGPKPTEIIHVDITAVQSQITDTIDRVEKAVIGVVNIKDGKQSGTGSGVIYRQDGTTYHAVTNEHVVGGADSVRVFIGHGRYINATIVGVDEFNDLAVISFTHVLGGLDTVDIHENHIVRRGEFVIAMGSPLGISYYNTATLGIVSARKGNLVQHDAAINPGNSGGPLFNIMGQLIGINVSKIMDTVSQGDIVPVIGIGFAIDMQTVKVSIAQIEEHGSVTRPKIGITVTSIAQYLTDGDKDPSFVPHDMTDGLIVLEVLEGSPGAIAGIEPYDIVLTLDGIDIITTDDVRLVMSSKRTGDTVGITLLRLVEGNFVEIELTMTL